MCPIALKRVSLFSLASLNQGFNIVLSSLYEYMFYSNIDVFDRWLRTKIKMLDNETPIEATKKIDSCNSLREFLMRSP